MFIVTFTPEAKRFVAAEALREGFAQPGLMVSRQGPKGDVLRTSEGRATWNIERPHPWRAQVGDFTSFGENPTDVFNFEGVLVWLALIPRPGENGVHVSLRDGQLWIEPQ